MATERQTKYIAVLKDRYTFSLKKTYKHPKLSERMHIHVAAEVIRDLERRLELVGKYLNMTSREALIFENKIDPSKPRVMHRIRKRGKN